MKRKFGLVGQDGVEVYHEAGLGRGDAQLGLRKEGLLSIYDKSKEEKSAYEGLHSCWGDSVAWMVAAGTCGWCYASHSSLGTVHTGAVQVLSHLGPPQSWENYSVCQITASRSFTSDRAAAYHTSKLQQKYSWKSGVR